MADDYGWLNDAGATADRLMMDIAGRIQVSPSLHLEAETNYNALAQWVDTHEGALKDRVTDIYPSGSFAIGAAIMGQVRKEQHDVDAVVELDLPLNSDPDYVLTELFKAIRRDPGSRYYEKTTLQSRCVTVTYDDGRTVDLMPVVRVPAGPDRVVQLHHWNREKGEKYHKLVNPSAFSEYFKRHVIISESFRQNFSDRLMLLEKADTQPLPEHVPLQRKAPMVVALQLIKRARNVAFRRRSHAGYRCPPSVVLAALALERVETSDSLLTETIQVAVQLHGAIDSASRRGELVSVHNPAWTEDVFTDRWPESLRSQKLYCDDLETLIADLEKLRRGGLSPQQQKEILEGQFGETPSTYAVDRLYESFGAARAAGRTVASASGTVAVLPTASASVSKRSPYGSDPLE